MIRPDRSVSMLLVLCFMVTSLGFGQTSQSLPNGWLTTPGSATNFIVNATADSVWQWHYDSTTFLAPGPIIINEIYVRSSAGTSVAAFSFPSFEVTCATATTDYRVGSHSTTFAANLSGDATVVRTGPWTGGPVPASGGATNTFIPFGLTTPFLYDPTSGNDFIIQIVKCGTVATWGASQDGAAGGVGVNGGNRYGNNSSCAATTSTAQNNEFVPIVRIDYTPAMGLFASFNGTPTSGSAPLAVQFTDTSSTSDPAGIQSWGWDFGDGNNSGVQNPMHTYTCPGTYSVTLVVIDTMNPLSSFTRTDYITVTPATNFSITTTGGGVGDLTLTPIGTQCYPAATRGFTLPSLAATPGVFGNGPFLGITPDFVTVTFITQPALPGHISHFVVTPTTYPNSGPVMFPPGFFGALTGATMDAVQILLNANGGLVFVSNVSQVTF